MDFIKRILEYQFHGAMGDMSLGFVLLMILIIAVSWLTLELISKFYFKSRQKRLTSQVKMMEKYHPELLEYYRAKLNQGDPFDQMAIADEILKVKKPEFYH